MALKILKQTSGTTLRVRPESNFGYLCGDISVKVDFQHMNANGEVMFQCIFSAAPFNADGMPQNSMDVQGVGISIPSNKMPAITVDPKKSMIENMNDIGLLAISAYLSEINPNASFEIAAITK